MPDVEIRKDLGCLMMTTRDNAPKPPGTNVGDGNETVSGNKQADRASLTHESSGTVFEMELRPTAIYAAAHSPIPSCMPLLVMQPELGEGMGLGIRINNSILDR